MKALLQSKSISLGLAMFSMFFGAGNVIFPLALGSYAGDKNAYAMMGLFITATLLPLLGVIAMVLYEGDHKRFFGRIGKIPGFLLAFLTISLLGPLGSTPRCIALSYTTLKMSFLEVSPIFFSAGACALIFALAFRRGHLLTLLGWILTPLLLISLFAIIILGLLAPSEMTTNVQPSLDVFIHGLKEGYNTMDLLAAFFFSSSILSLLSLGKEKHPIKTVYKASLVGAFLLGMTYLGFSYLAAFHGKSLIGKEKDELLSILTLKVGGAYGSILVCITVALACLTTAIALIDAFSQFVRKDIFKEKVPHGVVLFFSLVITFFVSTFQFTGISAFLNPMLELCYPVLIVLTFVNIGAFVFMRKRAR